MFNKAVIDLLFILLLSFVALFFLAFVQVNEPTKKDANANNDNVYLTVVG